MKYSKSALVGIIAMFVICVVIPAFVTLAHGRRNTCVEFTRWSLEAQSFSRASIF